MEEFFYLQEDNEKQINTIYKDSFKMLYYIALRIVQDEYLAEDVVQNVFIDFVKGDVFDKIEDADEEEVKKYLAKSTINQALTMRRQQNKERAFMEHNTCAVEEKTGNYTVEMSVEDAINCRKLLDTLEQLPAKYYEVLVEHTLKGKTCHVIAMQTGMGAEAVRKRVYRARRMLKEKLSFLYESESFEYEYKEG